jgi:hypothetical protein
VMDWLPRYEFDKCVKRYQGIGLVPIDWTQNRAA